MKSSVSFFLVLLVAVVANSSIKEIAKASLEKNIVKLNSGLFLSAGAHQFRSFWTRDFCMSVKGLLAAGRADVVKDHLEYLITHRRQDNLVPLYVDSMNPVLRVVAATFGIDSLPVKNEIAPYYLVNGEYEVADSNVLVLYAAKIYSDRTLNRGWFDGHKSDFKAIFDFYKSKLQDGLVVQGEHADWQDSSKRAGKTFFTNLLYYQAAKDYGFLSETELEALKGKIIEVFYDKKTGLFRSIEGRDNISLEGILWAIDYNLLVNSDQLYRDLAKHPLFTRYDIPGFATYPSYNSDDMYMQVKLVGLKEYHGNLLWSWLMAYAGKIAYKKFDTARVNLIRGQIEKILERDKTVSEIYENSPEHKAFSTFLYKSEAPFSWGSAFILDMEKTLQPL